MAAGSCGLPKDTYFKFRFSGTITQAVAVDEGKWKGDLEPSRISEIEAAAKASGRPVLDPGVLAVTELDELRREHAELVIGARLADLLSRTVDATAPTYPPTEYSVSGVWDRAALDDAAQDWVLTRLLERGDLAVILESARHIGAVRSMLTKSFRSTSRTAGNERVQQTSSPARRACFSLMMRLPLSARRASRCGS